MTTGFVIAIGLFWLINKVGNRWLDIYEYKIQHTKREDRWNW